MAKRILSVKNLVTRFNTSQGWLTAVDGVSFDVYRGKTLGIVGESGSGKSVTALSIMRLIPRGNSHIDGGEIWLEDTNLLALPDRDMRAIRGKRIAMIFQEPMTSLNPVLTVGYQMAEILTLHQIVHPQDVAEQCLELLQWVGIPGPQKCIRSYPHQLSGGMQQRVMIAMALAAQPTILIADEPTTALDVTIQAQILDLLMRLQEEMHMGIIFITHDLGVISQICHEVAVMYAGRIVEQAPVAALLNQPKHPYTYGLINSIPTLSPTQDPHTQRLPTIKGTVPTLGQLPPGCSFQDRCYRVQTDCKGEQGAPPLVEKADGQYAACFHPVPSEKTA